MCVSIVDCSRERERLQLIPVRFTLMVVAKNNLIDVTSGAQFSFSREKEKLECGIIFFSPIIKLIFVISHAFSVVVGVWAKASAPNVWV
jgi:hypothetical protein